MPELLPVLVRVGLVVMLIVGGSLFAFSAFVMAALSRVPAPEGIRAMQQINKTVFTPWFMVPFFATGVLGVGAVVVAIMRKDQPWWPLLLSAGLLSTAGVFIVTASGNVPLNDRLAALDADTPEAHDYWRRYLRVWTRWNHVRVSAAIASMLCLAETLRLMG